MQYSPTDLARPMPQRVELPQADCEACGRWQHCRSPIMPGYGNRNARVVLVGEYPGKSEDAVGQPWVGKAAPTFNRMLEEAGIGRGDVWMTNAVRCYSHKEVSGTQITQCSNLLFREIAGLPNAGLIVAMGKTAMQQITGEAAVTKRRGIITNFRKGRLVLRTFNPAAVMYNPQYMPRALSDWRLVGRYVKGTLQEDPANRRQELVTSIKDFRRLMQYLESCGRPVACDTETGSFAPWLGPARILCLSFCAEPHHAFVLPWNHRQHQWTEAEQREIHAGLKAYFENKQLLKVWQNGKFDDIQLRGLMGIAPAGYHFDTYLADYQLDVEQGGHSLEHMAWRWTKMGGYDLDFQARKAVLMREYGDAFDYGCFELEELAKYAGEDVDATQRCYLRLLPRLQEEGLLWVHQQILMPGITALSIMESNGIAIDRRYLTSITSELSSIRKQVAARIRSLPKVKEFETKLRQEKPKEAEKADKKGEPLFKLTSPQQVSAFLFKHCHLEPVKRGKDAYSTDNDVLHALSPKSAFCRHLINFRKADTNWKTFVKPVPRYLETHDGLVHTQYFAGFVETGRLSSRNPNMQNQPGVLDDIAAKLGIPPVRGLFVSRWNDYSQGTPQWLHNKCAAKCEHQECKHLSVDDLRQDLGYLIEFDLSQIEVRLMAHYSRDTALIEIFSRGGDVHRATAARAYGIPEDQVTELQRFRAKRIVFCMNYGGSKYKMAELADCTVEEAQAFIDGYFAAFPGVQAWMREQWADLRRHKRCWTKFGRYRWLWNITSQDDGRRREAERQATNTPIQGTAGDINALALNAIVPAIQNSQLRSVVCNTVHDSIVTDVHPGELRHVIAIHQAVYQGVRDRLTWMDVPILYDAKVGPRWSEMKELQLAA